MKCNFFLEKTFFKILFFVFFFQLFNIFIFWLLQIDLLLFLIFLDNGFELFAIIFK